MIEASTLSAIGGIRHGFFTRQGGHSSGLYASLNTGLGSQDDRETVKRNRAKICSVLGVSAVVTPYQVHSPDAVIVETPWDHDLPDSVPRADAVVTSRPGFAIAVNTADCTPVLFASGDGKVAGAAHAGWKGAIGGVLASTVERMRELGAKDIHAAIGPTISQANYEVGPEFQAQFVARDPAHARFFVPSVKPAHFMFDLPGFVRAGLEALELASIEDLALCTYADEQRFFSYRRTTHRAEPDYGRQLSAICIKP
jgi:YfiH family protein